jgi:hypothetical protein
MIGDCLKGILFTTFLGFAFLGIATVIPDPVWDQVPPRVVPVRTYLADRGVINEKYASAPTSSSSVAEEPRPNEPTAAPASRERAGEVADMVCSDGVCRLEDRETKQASGQEMPNFIPLASVDSREEIPTGPVRNEMPEPNRFPTDKTDFFVPRNESAFVPEQGPADPGFGDTLPELGFGEEPFPEEDFPIPNQTESSVVRGAAQEPPTQTFSSNDSSYRKSSPFKSVNHYEQDKAPQSTSIAPNADHPNKSAVAPKALDPSVHEQIVSLVNRGEGPGAISASFLGLNRILEEHGDELTEEDRGLLNNALDRMAYRVFYQPGENVLWEEYTPGPRETLGTVAAQYRVTPEFLAAINALRLKSDDPFPDGQKLKVVEGPVSADVSFSKMELLLKFNGLYAGRFKMGCARRAEQVRGEFPVVRKIKNPEYNGPLDDGSIGRIAGGDTRNPLGSYWIELEGGLGLQGTNREDRVGRKTAAVGGLIFSNKDITHLNILLAQGAIVRVID